MNRDLARGLLAGACVYLMVAGVWVALATPPLSGGTIAGVLLISCGGGVLARVAHVQGRREL